MNRAAALAGFLGQAAQTPFGEGTHDCCLWLADWVRIARRLRHDPAAAFRGRYGDRDGALRLLARGGGLPAVVAACAEAAGLALTGAPVAGDIGVIETVTADGIRPVGAIFDSGGWVALAPCGLVRGPAVPLLAWSV